MRVVPPLPPEIWEKTPPEVRDAVLALVLVFEQRIAALEARLGQDSSNSSRPPSSDGPEVKRGVPRPPSPRRRGGQKGHPKHQRVILPPDQVIDHRPPRCGHCQSPLVGDDPEPIIEQVVDLPVVMRHVIHHRRHTLACPHCRATTTAPTVPEAARGFGPRLQAATAYFSGVGRLGKRAIRQLLADLHGIPISLGGVSNLEARTSLALQPIHDEALAHVRGLDANVDETAWKQGLEKAWPWVAVTKAVTVFLVRRHRDRGAFDDLVGPAPGVMTTDRFSVYAHLDDAKHQVCWAHLRRDLQAMIDRRDRGSGTGEDLLMHAEILAEHWPEVREGRRSRAWFAQEILPWLREEVRHLLDRGVAVRPPQDGQRSSRASGDRGQSVAFRVSRGRGADQQRGRAGGPPRGVLEEDQLRDRRRAGQPVRGADAERGGQLPIAGPRRDGVPDPGHHGRHDRAGSLRTTVNPANRSVNGYHCPTLCLDHPCSPTHQPIPADR